MNSWSIGSLRDFVKNRDLDENKALELINSIDRSIQLFSYHIYTAKKENDDITPNSSSGRADLMFKTMKHSGDFEQQTIRIQANIQAAVHLARSIHDVFAQLVNHLVLEDQHSVRQCDFPTIVKSLKESKLKSKMASLHNSEEYSYINSMVNTIKHRNLVGFGTQISFQTDEAGVRFKSFEYNNKTYPELWAEEVLEKIISVKNSVVLAGVILNEQVGA